MSRVQAGLALCAPIAVLGLTYGLLTREYLEAAAGLVLFGLALTGVFPLVDCGMPAAVHW